MLFLLSFPVLNMTVIFSLKMSNSRPILVHLNSLMPKMSTCRQFIFHYDVRFHISASYISCSYHNSVFWVFLSCMMAATGYPKGFNLAKSYTQLLFWKLPSSSSEAFNCHPNWGGQSFVILYFSIFLTFFAKCSSEYEMMPLALSLQWSSPSSIFLCCCCPVWMPACFSWATGMTITFLVTLLGIYIVGIHSWRSSLIFLRTSPITL